MVVWVSIFFFWLFNYVSTHALWNCWLIYLSFSKKKSDAKAKTIQREYCWVAICCLCTRYKSACNIVQNLLEHNQRYLWGLCAWTCSREKERRFWFSKMMRFAKTRMNGKACILCQNHYHWLIYIFVIVAEQRIFLICRLCLCTCMCDMCLLQCELLAQILFNI